MSSERQLLVENDPWWGEHVHRYNEVIKQLHGNERILDIACGTGFGSDILARHTTGQVFGGDISRETIDQCIQNWNQPNLSFQILDGTQLNFDDEYFDIIVSFETIEHTSKYKQMIQEFARVLKKAGTAYISTPNFPVNSPSGKVTNPYHTQEFTFEQLQNLLDSVFAKSVLMGQKYSRYDTGAPKYGKVIEQILSIRGIRKMPYKLKNALMNLIIKKPFYPTEKDFSLTTNHTEILACKTFFCVCKR